MKWLNITIEIYTISNLYAIFIFSLLSTACSIITILIYMRIKQLRTIIYRFFFHISINELLSRATYLIRFLFNPQRITIYRVTCFITYLADTNILILVAFACFGMNKLILKQNTKLANQFNKYSIFLYIFSIVITTIFYIISINDDDDDLYKRDTDLYRNIIGLNFITDEMNPNLAPLLYTNIIYYLICFYCLFNVVLILLFIKDRVNISKDSIGKDELNYEKQVKNALKMRTFKIKLISYPILAFAYVLPLTIYGWIEFAYLSNKDSFEENMDYFRIRYCFFNIYFFLNSIRGLLFFNVFIMNEKIKIILFKKFLNFEIFKTIDKIKIDEDSERMSSVSIESKNKNVDRELSFTGDDSFDFTIKKKHKKKRRKKVIKKEEEDDVSDDVSDDDNNIGEEIDLYSSKPISKIGLINGNDSDEDDEIKRDSKSESLKSKKSLLDS